MTDFKREIRYQVIKLKTGKVVNCVVVEDDWLEYEQVWDMIQARVEGKPNEITQLREQVLQLQSQLRVEAKLREDNLKEPAAGHNYWERYYKAKLSVESEENLKTILQLQENNVKLQKALDLANDHMMLYIPHYHSGFSVHTAIQQALGKDE